MKDLLNVINKTERWIEYTTPEDTIVKVELVDWDDYTAIAEKRDVNNQLILATCYLKNIKSVENVEEVHEAICKYLADRLKYSKN